MKRQHLAVRWILVVGAAIFVDNMRLLYVCTIFGQPRNKSNESRFPEFVSICEEHLSDFDSQVLRFMPYLENGFVEKIRTVEKGLRWQFTRLKNRPQLALGREQLFHESVKIAEELDSICRASMVEDYEQALRIVEQIGSELNPHESSVAQSDAATLLHLRLSIQDEFLQQAQHHEQMKIFTIADDRNQRYALPYFLIDLWLLRRSNNRWRDQATAPLPPSSERRW